jgi:catechol 2,3-dioxygenase-like lactoylglutathione lyase family enzyme
MTGRTPSARLGCVECDETRTVSRVLASHPIVAFVATSNPSRALAFYRDVLGLPLVSDDPYAMLFDARGTKLRIQKVSEVAVAPYTALGWSVPNIATAVKALTAKGVKFQRYGHFEQDPLGVWRSPSGQQVAWFHDPDGHTLSITQY